MARIAGVVAIHIQHGADGAVQESRDGRGISAPSVGGQSILHQGGASKAEQVAQPEQAIGQGIGLAIVVDVQRQHAGRQQGAVLEQFQQWAATAQGRVAQGRG